MKKNYILLAFIALLFGAKAQTSVIDTITFEPINLALDTFWNGKDQSGGFSDPDFSDIEFKTVYDTSFGGFWSGGFAQSTVRDSVDGSFNNLYGSRSANGANGSSTYTVFSPTSLTDEIVYSGTSSITAVNGLWINNTTFAVDALINGNFFSRPFGDTTGGNTGEDYFFASFYDENGASVDFYLADYRFSDSAMDYVIKDWTYVDLSSIGKLVRIELTSSDTNASGQSNTPSYFAVDNVVVERSTVGTEELFISDVNVYPNPTTDYLNISLNKAANSTVSVLNANGQVVLSSVYATNNNFVLNVQSLSQGTYFLKVIANNKVVTKRFIKQ